MEEEVKENNTEPLQNDTVVEGQPVKEESKKKVKEKEKKLTRKKMNLLKLIWT